MKTRSRNSFTRLWHPFLRQVEAAETADAHQFTLYGGYRGPGKSYWLRWYLLRHLLDLAKTDVRGARVGLFCETYPTLTDRQIGPIEREFPAEIGQLRKSQEFGLGFHLHPRHGGGVLLLRNLDDTSKYKSAEFAAMGVDQLEQNTKETFDLLRGSLRWPGVKQPRFVATANPGGIGHLWVKRLWVDRQFPPELQPLADQFAFVEARPEDNPYLDAAYWHMLETLPDGLRQAWRYGNWDIFEGQAFPEWRRDVHVIEPFEIPKDWRRFRALDYGYAAPSCVGWFAVDCTDPRKLYLYRELYVKGLGPAELARVILEAERPVGRTLVRPDNWQTDDVEVGGLKSALRERVDYTVADPSIFRRNEQTDDVEVGGLKSALRERVDYTVADPSIFRRNEQSHVSNADVMSVNGAPCIEGHNHRISGWRMVHEYLKVYQEPAGGEMVDTALLKVFRTCPNVIRTLPAVVCDLTRPEDVDSRSEDHAADMVRYAVMSRPPLDLAWQPRPPEPKPYRRGIWKLLEEGEKLRRWHEYGEPYWD